MSHELDQVFKINWKLKNPMEQPMKNIDEFINFSSYLKKMTYMLTSLNFDLFYNESMLRTNHVTPTRETAIFKAFDKKDESIDKTSPWYINGVAVLNRVSKQIIDYKNVDLQSNLVGVTNVKLVAAAGNTWLAILNTLSIKDFDVFGKQADEYYKTIKDIPKTDKLTKELYANVLIENIKPLYEQSQNKNIGTFDNRDGFISLVKSIETLWSKTTFKNGISAGMYTHLSSYNNLMQMLYINHYLFDEYLKIPSYAFDAYLNYIQLPIFKYLRACVVLMYDQEIDEIYKKIEKKLENEFDETTKDKNVKFKPDSNRNYLFKLLITLLKFRLVRTPDIKPQIHNENSHKTTIILLFIEYLQWNLFYVDKSVHINENSELVEKFKKIDENHNYGKSILNLSTLLVQLMLKLKKEKKIYLFTDIKFNDNPSLPFYVQHYFTEIKDQLTIAGLKQKFEQFNSSLKNYVFVPVRKTNKTPIVPYHANDMGVRDTKILRYNSLLNNAHHAMIELEVAMKEFKKPVDKYVRAIEPGRLYELEITFFATRESKLKSPLIVTKMQKHVGFLTNPRGDKKWNDDFETTNLIEIRNQISYIIKKVEMLTKSGSIETRMDLNQNDVITNFFKDISSTLSKILDGSKKSFSLVTYQFMQNKLIDNKEDISIYDSNKKAFPTTNVFEKHAYILCIMATTLKSVRGLIYEMLKDFNMTTKISKLFVGDKMEKISNEEELVYFLILELYQWLENARIKIDYDAKKYFRFEDYAEDFSNYPFPKFLVTNDATIPLQKSSNDKYPVTFYNHEPKHEDSFENLFEDEFKMAIKEKIFTESSIQNLIGVKNWLHRSNDDDPLHKYFVLSEKKGGTYRFTYNGDVYRIDMKDKVEKHNQNIIKLYGHIEDRLKNDYKIDEKFQTSDYILPFKTDIDDAKNNTNNNNFEFLLPIISLESRSDVVVVFINEIKLDQFRVDKYLVRAYEYIKNYKNTLKKDEKNGFKKNTLFFLYDDDKYYLLKNKLLSYTEETENLNEKTLLEDTKNENNEFVDTLLEKFEKLSIDSSKKEFDDIKTILKNKKTK